MITVSRWSVGENQFRIEVSNSPATLITHYYRSGGEVKSIDVALTSLGRGVYSYSVDPELSLLDSFKLWNGSTLVLFFKSDDFSRDSLSGSQSWSGETLVKGPLEDREAKVSGFTWWEHYPWNSEGRIEARFTNIFPQFGGKFFGLGEDGFSGYLSPKSATRDSINQMLEDAEALFNGQSGTVFILVDDGLLVIPFSDGTSTWTMESEIPGAPYPIGIIPNRPDGEDGNWYVKGEPYWKKDAWPEYVETAKDENLKWAGDGDLSTEFYRDDSFSVALDVYGIDPAPMDDNFYSSVDTYFAWPSSAYEIFGGL